MSLVYGSPKEKRLAYLNERTTFETVETIYNEEKDLYYNYDSNHKLISIQRLIKIGTKEIITKKYPIFEMIEDTFSKAFKVIAIFPALYGIYLMEHIGGIIFGLIVYYFFIGFFLILPFYLIEEYINQVKNYEEYREYEFVNMGGGFNMKAPAILYYICIDNHIYKIGITNNTVQTRFSSKELKKIRIVKIWEHQIGQDAYNEEQHIIKKFKRYKYKSNDLLESGNTELFNRDILQLDIA